jgi:hypothetical protein
MLPDVKFLRPCQSGVKETLTRCQSREAVRCSDSAAIKPGSLARGGDWELDRLRLKRQEDSGVVQPRKLHIFTIWWGSMLRLLARDSPGAHGEFESNPAAYSGTHSCGKAAVR